MVGMNTIVGNMGNMEVLAAVLVVAFSAAVATDYVQLPYALFSSPITAVGLILASLCMFALYPMIGFAMFLLTVVLFFKRNVYSTIFSAQAVYGKQSIREQPHVDAVPSETMRSGPRSYDQFDETDSANPMIGPVMEAFEPAPYGDEQGAPVDGQYPIEEEGPAAHSVQDTYIYRPEKDTGSNEFIRDGPDLDVKKGQFAY